MKLMENVFRRTLPLALAVLMAMIAGPLVGARVLAQDTVAVPAHATHPAGGEANLVIPDLQNTSVHVTFFGMSGHTLLLSGLVVCVLGLMFGLVIYTRLKNMAVHASMREVSELIYETCKTYLITQGKFILLLEVFIGIVIALYFGVLVHFPVDKVVIILLFSLIGIAGSYGVAWFGIRVNTFANSRTAFAALRGKPYPCYAIPLKSGISIGTLLISVELVMMLIILLYVPGSYAGPCFIGFAIGESLGAAALRIAGGITAAVEALNGTSGIEVEAETLAQVREALDAGVGRILLDNMSPQEVAQAVELTAGRAELEASGGMSLATVRAYADTGVDFISVGALTHGARSLHVSLEVR